MHIPKGTVVAMLTPFDNEGKVNEIEVRKMVTFFIAKGVDGIFPVASCCEYTHIDIAERKFLIDVVADEARGRVDIIPGSGSTCFNADCTMCGMCNGDRCSNKQETSELPRNLESFHPNQIFKENGNGNSGISKDYLEKLVSEVVKNLINERL